MQLINLRCIHLHLQACQSWTTILTVKSGWKFSNFSHEMCTKKSLLHSLHCVLDGCDSKKRGLPEAASQTPPQPWGRRPPGQHSSMEHTPASASWSWPSRAAPRRSQRGWSHTWGTTLALPPANTTCLDSRLNHHSPQRHAYHFISFFLYNTEDI